MVIELDLLKEITYYLQEYFGCKVIVDKFQFLSGPDRRNRIARLFLSQNREGVESVIFK